MLEFLVAWFDDVMSWLCGVVGVVWCGVQAAFGVDRPIVTRSRAAAGRQQSLPQQQQGLQTGALSLGYGPAPGMTLAGGGGGLLRKQSSTRHGPARLPSLAAGGAAAGGFGGGGGPARLPSLAAGGAAAGGFGGGGRTPGYGADAKRKRGEPGEIGGAGELGGLLASMPSLRERPQVRGMREMCFEMQCAAC